MASLPGTQLGRGWGGLARAGAEAGTRRKPDRLSHWTYVAGLRREGTRFGQRQVFLEDQKRQPGTLDESQKPLFVLPAELEPKWPNPGPLARQTSVEPASGSSPWVSGARVLGPILGPIPLWKK